VAILQRERSHSTGRQLPHIGETTGNGFALAIACFISYWFTTHIVSRAYFVSRNETFLGGMWAVIATIFVYRSCYQQTVSAALADMATSLLSFVLCLGYLLVFPFSAGGMAALIGIGAVANILIGRPKDIVTTGTATTVVMVVAGMNPNHAWIQPILRLIDTMIGIAVGIAATQVAQKLVSTRSVNPASEVQS
jgi:uncharacterized membrane protein YccC